MASTAAVDLLCLMGTSQWVSYGLWSKELPLELHWPTWGLIHNKEMTVPGMCSLHLSSTRPSIPILITVLSTVLFCSQSLGLSRPVAMTASLMQSTPALWRSWISADVQTDAEQLGKKTSSSEIGPRLLCWTLSAVSKSFAAVPSAASCDGEAMFISLPGTTFLGGSKPNLKELNKVAPRAQDSGWPPDTKNFTCRHQFQILRES